ncbi:MAG: sulfate ABC transporter permease subunit CysT [Agathobacter rectalis]
MKYTATDKTSKEKTKSKNIKTRVIPGYHLSLGIVVTMLSVIVLIPLASVLVYSLKISPGDFVALIMKENVRNAFITSITSSFIAAIVNVVFGLIVAWTLVKYDFPGKWLLDGLIELPFALPTAVAGITLSKLYSGTDFFGKLGIDVAYTQTGIVVALVFVGIPFVIRAVQPVLEKMDNTYEEAAYMLGATPSKTFFKVILPELRPALLTGFGLAFARGIGEYGSVIYISGNSARHRTQVVSYVIMQKLSYIDYASATAIALVMLVISFLLLLFVNIVQVKQSQRTNLL